MSVLPSLQPSPSDSGQQDEALRRATGRPLRAPSSRFAGGSTRRQLLVIAEHLTGTRPTDVMTEAARMILALHTAGSAPASRPLLALMPWPTAGITRGEYGLLLRRTEHAARVHTALPNQTTPTCERACPDCSGAGGKTVDTSSGGVSRQTWKTCGTCRGKGTV